MSNAKLTGIRLAGVLLLFAWAGSPAEEKADSEDYESPISASDDLGIGADLGTEDAKFSGNPLGSLISNWPPDLVVAPVPGRSPQVGWNLAVAAGYFLTPKDEGSKVPPSLIGAYGFIAENGSNVYGGGVKLNLLDDKLRLVAGAGYADVRYRLYGIGRAQGDTGFGVDILQEGPAYFAKLQWRMFGNFYAGLAYLGGRIDTRLRLGLPDPPPPFDPTLSLDVGAVSIPLEIDSRDHEYFPRSGWLWKADARFYRESLGSDFNTEVFKLSANHYLSVRERDVLATRFVIRATGKDAPFFIQSTFGGSTDLRGYPGGRYRDRMMYAVQTEYRWQVNDKWVLTGFAGFGDVAGSLSEFDSDFLPAAGVGARRVISQKHRVSLSVDVAAGEDGTEYYFGIGEAF